MIVDRHLLFGLLALQNEFIAKSDLVAAFKAWIADQSKTLDETLVMQDALNEEDRSLLSRLVDRHITAHGGDVTASLRSLSSIGPIREELEQLADRDVTASMARLRPSDQKSTLAPSGTATSSGQRFEYLRPLARGGLGVVSVALDKELNREIALKEIRADRADEEVYRSKFVLEAEVTGGLEHPGIVPVYGLGTGRDGRPYYAMRLIKGNNLLEHIKRFHQDVAAGKEPFDGTALRKLLRRFLDVCQAIHYAHSRGVLHRDLKPGNIMLGKYGETLVVDWGLAKPLGVHRRELSSPGDQTDLEPSIIPSGSNDGMTIQGSIVGTAAYAPPEQLTGNLDQISERSDIYGLGAMLYELLAGQPPVQGSTIEAVIQIVVAGAIKPPRSLQPRVPKPLDAICMRALAKKPEDRHQTAAALGQEIELWLDDLPVPSYPEPLPMRTRRWMRGHQTLVATVSAIVLMTTIGLGLFSMVISQNNVALLAANKREAAERENANAATKKAEKNALTAETRYFLSSNDVPNALNRLEKINLNTTIEEKESSRVGAQLLFNELIDKSRSRVRFLQSMPIKKGEYLFIDQNNVINWEQNRRSIYAYDLQRGEEKEVTLDYAPNKLLQAGAFAMACGVRNLSTISISPKPSVRAAKTFLDDIELVCSSKNFVGIIKNQRDFELLNATDLTSHYKCALKEFPGNFPIRGRERYFVSANGRYVIVHAVPWTNPATLIDTFSNKSKQLKEGELALSTTGTVVFDNNFENRFYGIFSPSRFGGLDDVLSQYEISEALDLRVPARWRVDSMTTKVIEDLCLKDDELVVFGAEGFVTVAKNQSQSGKPESYQNIWPTSSCSYVGSSGEGSVFAMRAEDKLLAFQVLSDDDKSDGYDSSDYSNASCIDGTINVSKVTSDSGAKLNVIYRPLDSSKPIVTREVPWLTDEGQNVWLPWGIDVSASDRFVAILAQETDGSNVVSARFIRKNVIIYDTQLGIDQPTSWKSIANIPLLEHKGIHGFEDRAIRLSADGETLYVRSGDVVSLYRVGNGKPEKRFKQRFDIVSPDGRYFVAKSGKDEYDVFDMCTFDHKMDVKSAIFGGCFSYDNRTLSISTKSSIIDFELETAKQLRKISTRFIPLAYLKNMECLVAYAPSENEFSTGKLLLLNRDDMTVVATLSQNYQLKNSIDIIGQDLGIYYQVHRWSFKATRLMDYTGLLSELTKPAFSNTIIQVAGDRADEKIVSPTVSETDQADRAIPLLREVDNNNFNQLKVSDPDLDQHVGKKIQLEGQVQSVSLTYANNAANIIFQFKPQNNAPMIWISKTVYKNMMDKGVDPQNLEGKFIGARGVLGNYGGRTEEWKNRLQLTLESAEEIGVIDPK